MGEMCNLSLLNIKFFKKFALFFEYFKIFLLGWTETI